MQKQVNDNNISNNFQTDPVNINRFRKKPSCIQLDLFLNKCMLNYKFLCITLRMFGDNKPPPTQPFSDTLIDKITLSYWIIKHIK